MKSLRFLPLFLVAAALPVILTGCNKSSDMSSAPSTDTNTPPATASTDTNAAPAATTDTNAAPATNAPSTMPSTNSGT